MHRARISSCLPVSLLLCGSALGQSAPDTAQSGPAVEQKLAACAETPREDASPALCAPPSSEEERGAVEPAAPATIPLTLPAGTPLRIALDQRVRIGDSGAIVHGKVVEAVLFRAATMWFCLRTRDSRLGSDRRTRKLLRRSPNSGYGS